MLRLKALTQIKITKKKFLITFVSTLTLTAGLFGYFYWKKTSIVSMVNDIPIVEYTKPPKYVHDLFGSEKMPFQMPLGVLAVNGEVYVSDSDMGSIQVLDYNGTFKRVFGNKEGRGQLRNPYGMAMYKGILYVADGGLGKIMMFDRQGEYQGSLTPKENGIMTSPAGIVVMDDKIYFTDLGLRTVNVMDLEGNVMMVFGSKGETEGQFDYPHGITVDGENNIYVADSGNNRVQLFNEDGVFQRVVGDEKGEIGTPRGIALDQKGNLYVVSGIENRVHVFDKKGKWVFAFNEVAQKDSLSLPNGISLDGNGHIFITETGTSKIALFSFNDISL